MLGSWRRRPIIAQSKAPTGCALQDSPIPPAKIMAAAPNASSTPSEAGKEPSAVLEVVPATGVETHVPLRRLCATPRFWVSAGAIGQHFAPFKVTLFIGSPILAPSPR